jgi:hypothetical protein
MCFGFCLLGAGAAVCGPPLSPPGLGGCRRPVRRGGLLEVVTIAGDGGSDYGGPSAPGRQRFSGQGSIQGSNLGKQVSQLLAFLVPASTRKWWLTRRVVD